MGKKSNKTEQLVEKMFTDHRVRADVVRSSLEHFFPFYFHQYMEYQTAPFQKEIFNILEDERIKLAVICAFRGSAKSTIITTAYVLWSILGVQQRKFIVICAQTDQKARQYLTNIRLELMQNDLLKRDLGPFTEEHTGLGPATAIIIKRLNVKIMISSVEQSIRGMRHGEHRPDLIIFDDIEDIDSVRTKESRDKAFNWMTGEMIPAGDKRTRTIVVGNLLHEDSVIKRLEEKINHGELSHLNAIYREYPIMDEQGNALWPGKYPTPEDIEAERQKTMSDTAWYREYLLKIISTEEQIVHPKWIQTYDRLPLRGSGSFRSIAIGVDLAVSEKDSADCTAVVIGHIHGYGKHMKIYIQPDPLNMRVPFPVQVEMLKAVIATQKDQHHHRVKTYIEDVAYQKAIVQLLQSGKYDVEGVPTGKSDKTARLRLATPFIKNGQVLFPEKGCEELIMQLIGFGKEKHDDLADAFAMLVLKAVENNPRMGSAGVGRGDQI